MRKYKIAPFKKALLLSSNFKILNPKMLKSSSMQKAINVYILALYFHQKSIVIQYNFYSLSFGFI